MKKIIFILMLISLFSLISPQFSYAQYESQPPTPSGTGGSGTGFTGPLLVKCSGGNAISNGADGTASENECTWSDVIAQINKLVNFLFFFAVILGTISLIYCGFLFLTAGGDTGKAGDAKNVFFKVIWGFIWVFAAWLIVHFITTALGLSSGISII